MSEFCEPHECVAQLKARHSYFATNPNGSVFIFRPTTRIPALLIVGHASLRQPRELRNSAQAQLRAKLSGKADVIARVRARVRVKALARGKR
jgi:hypothetical protein